MAKVELKLYATLGEIDDAVKAFHKRGQSLQSEAHRIACSVLKHVGEHGDIRVVAKFLQAMPELSRVNALRAWFEAFGPVTFQGNAPVYVKGGKTKLGEAMAEPFWKFKLEPAYQPIDPVKALESLIKRFKTDMKETQRDHSAIIAALAKIAVDEPEVTAEDAPELLVVASAAEVAQPTIQ